MNKKKINKLYKEHQENTIRHDESLIIFGLDEVILDIKKNKITFIDGNLTISLNQNIKQTKYIEWIGLLKTKEKEYIVLLGTTSNPFNPKYEILPKINNKVLAMPSSYINWIN